MPPLVHLANSSTYSAGFIFRLLSDFRSDVLLDLTPSVGRDNDAGWQSGHHLEHCLEVGVADASITKIY